MSLETVRADLAVRAPDLVVMVTEASTATVQLAAEVHGVAPGQIAKTLAIRVGDREFLLACFRDAGALPALHELARRADLNPSVRPRLERAIGLIERH